MKIQCNVCEAAEAVLLCCADEAALCLLCDENVHAANKLASKHQRVLIDNCPRVIFVRKQLATSFVLKTGPYCAENVTFPYTLNSSFITSEVSAYRRQSKSRSC